MGNNEQVTVWVGTKKGAFTLRSNGSRSGQFAIDGPHFLGCEVFHVVQDPRDPCSLLVATKTGHLGPTMYRSVDGGKTWIEASKPPQFPKASKGEKGLSVNRVFWLEPGHASQAGVWWAGVDIEGPDQPGSIGDLPCIVALFRTTDGGATWDEISGFRDFLSALPDAKEKFGFAPGGAMLHSIRIDPRDAKHLFASVSTGGTFESGDEGASWKPLNKGVAADFLPEGDHEFGHDPHCLTIHPANPDRLYQQNHCGIYRLDRPGDTWERVGDNMPKAVGDIGFPVVPHPRNQDTVWVFPMDGGTVWPRTSPDGKPGPPTREQPGSARTRACRPSSPSGPCCVKR